MIKTRRLSLSLIVCLFVAFAMLNLMEDKALASSITLPEEYYFVFNGQQKEAGTEYEMKSSEILLNVSADTWAPAATVEWVSSEPDVVTLENTSYGSEFIKLVRKGPGYSTITAVISDGTNSYSLSCLVKIDLELDYQNFVIATTTNERILVLDEVDPEKQVHLKYVDYAAVSGAAISSSAVIWESDNEGVATVDDSGKVTAVGSGSATITVITNTMSSQGSALQIEATVVVKPTFSLIYDDTLGVHHEEDSIDDVNVANPAEGVPSNFVIQSNATLAENLNWEVYDTSTGEKLSSDASSKMMYTVSAISGNVSFRNVKAGTYEIYAFANENYNNSTNAPYAYMKIIVPIEVGEKNIIMTVGDTYSILENSNIPSVNIFEYSYEEGNLNIARLDQTTGIITARTKGQVKLKLVYKTSQNLYDNASVIIDDIYINITVVDGISLSATNATLYTAGTLLLNAIVTDPTEPIIWSSSDTNIATVEDGLVTTINEGLVTITARQTINGVVKSSSCQITVQQSVSTITVDPDEVSLAIEDYKTLHANITPANLSGVTLQWKSSNENIVSIVEANALTTTIQGVAGGTAVISAINKNNVVVGYSHITVQQPVTSLVLSETQGTLDLSTKRFQLRATVYPENVVNKTVTWSSTDASIVGVDQNGLITILKAGTVSIIATSDDNPEVTAICNLTIEIPVISIALDVKEKTMYVGEADRLSYILLPTNASNNNVTWTSTNTSVVSVNSTGKVTAKGVGTAVIILKSLEGGHTVYCTINVKQVANTVKFDKKELEMRSGEYYYMRTTLSPTSSTDTDLIWESSDTKVAVVDDNGKVVAKEAGTAIIMARTEVGGMAYCNLTVLQPVEGLIMNYSDKTLFLGDDFKLMVSVSPSEATEINVTWKSSNTKVATVSEDGVVVGLIGGTAVITCTTDDGGYSATCVVTVRELMSSIALNYESYRLGVDKTVKLVATVTTETATNHDVTWISSNEKVASISSKGKVTAISIGTATITAIAQDGSEVEVSCEIEVVKPVTSVSLNKNYISIFVGESREMKVTIKPKNATYTDAIWSSSDESIAIVDEDGMITGLKAGSATVIAEAQDNTGKKALCVVSVKERVPSTSIIVMDKELVMVPGEEKVVQVALNPVTSTDGFVWSTDNSAVVKIDKNSGRIIARATGTANVTVMTDSGKTAMIEVTVIGLNITELTIEQYTTYPYPLRVEGATGTVRWSIDNPQIAEVTNGVVSTRAVGTATITALVNGRTLKCKLKVTKIR